MEKIERFIEEDTRNIVHGTMMPQSPSKQAPWDLTQCSQMPSAAPSYFPASRRRSEVSSLSEGSLVWGKADSLQISSSSHTVSRRSLLMAARTCSTFSGVLLAAGLPGCASVSRDSRPPSERSCHTFICCALIASSLEAF